MSEVPTDTRSKEYVEWMANVWRLNDERNKRLKKEAGDYSPAFQHNGE